MLSHYFTTALRTLKRDSHFGGINIVSLAVALSAAILIILFIRDELAYDDWGTDTDRLYRLEGSTVNDSEGQEFYGVSPGRMRDPLAKDFSSDIEVISRLYNDVHFFQHKGEAYVEDISYVDASFFEIFDIETSLGNRDAVFSDNQSILLTESMAQKYFGDADPVGQIMSPNDADFSYRIVGVIADPPENSHLVFDFIAFFDPERVRDAPWVATFWQYSNVYTYLKLSETADAAALERELPAFMDRNVIAGEAPGVVGPLSDYIKLRLMPVGDIHLKSNGRFQMKPGGDMRLVVSFGIVAALILFIACVNFINLATARASLRMREIALRKVVGARRHQLVGQMLLETMITVWISLLIALTIVEAVLPSFNSFIEKVLQLEFANDPVALVMVMGLLAVVTLSAGLHPAINISRIKPGPFLHTSGSAWNAGGKLRSALVTLQFAISISLTVITLVVAGQTAYTQNKDLGFATDNRLILQGLHFRDARVQANTIRAEIDMLPGVETTSHSYRPLPMRGQWGGAFQKIGDPSQTNYSIEDLPLDYGFLEFIEAKLIAGRLFDPARELDKWHRSPSDPNIIEIPKVLNRQAVKHLGYDSPEAAIGQSFMYDAFNGRTRVTIIGVVEDMHMSSLHRSIDPMGFFIPFESFTSLYVKFLPGHEVETRRQIGAIWKKHVPTLPVDLQSLNETYHGLYVAERQRGEIFAGFAFFAIFVSAIGLFSQSAFAAQNRTREIGIRKVMGASKLSIMKLMFWQFSKPVLIANLIAWPIAWYLVSDWLSGFAYRIDLTPLPFLGASLLALLIAGVTVSVHALRVSGANPINALRHE
jgi:putative ABC transport system permease protein